MFIGRLLAVSVLVAAGAYGQSPALTTIQDTLFEANGTLLNATAVITWNTFQAADGTNVNGGSVSVPIVAGSLYVQLVPNTTATPSVPYAVTYSSDGMNQWQEMWMVPPSTSPLRLVDIRTSFVSGGGGVGGGGVSSGGGGSGPVSESNVTGLVSDLSARPLKGPAYGTGRVAIVDANGDLDTAVGNSTDCVYVSGTSGPCFDATQLPNYSDGESPSGVVDGSNTTFGLAGLPTPAKSLILFRNGIAQMQGFDYALTGSSIQFNAGAGPQPGDTLLAWYRTPSIASQLSPEVARADAAGKSLARSSANIQVICSATGTQTNAIRMTSLGTCTIPAKSLASGDRVEIQSLFAHNGKLNGFTYAVVWGATTAVQRKGGAADARISAKADASVTSVSTEISGASFGTILASLPFFVTARDSNEGPITIDFQAAMSAAGRDTMQLVNYTVTRYPAISNP